MNMNPNNSNNMIDMILPIMILESRLSQDGCDKKAPYLDETFLLGANLKAPAVSHNLVSQHNMIGKKADQPKEQPLTVKKPKPIKARMESCRLIRLI